MRAPERINPLLQPKVETSMARAIRIAPRGPRITPATAVATRPSAANSIPRDSAVAPCGSPPSGSTLRYARFASVYNRITVPVPSASDNGKFRFGFLTSPAVNVTLFQASIEKSEPTIATPTSVRVAIIHVGPSGGYGCIADNFAPRQKSVKFAVWAIAVLNPNPHTRVRLRSRKHSNPHAANSRCNLP